MNYVEALNKPHPDAPRPYLFAAGGITDCPDWQKELAENLADLDFTFLNPRRANFPIDDPKAARAQITWEHELLWKADIIPFWFCAATLNPIVLYELGTHLSRASSGLPVEIVVGIEPGYERTQDVMIQTELTKLQVMVTYDLNVMASVLRGMIMKMK